MAAPVWKHTFVNTKPASAISLKRQSRIGEKSICALLVRIFQRLTVQAVCDI